MHSIRRLPRWAAGVLLVTACGGAPDDEKQPPDADGSVDSAVPEFSWGVIDFDPDADPPALLSALHLLRWTGETLEYNDGVLPYALNTPLFSDYATKDRVIWMPAGTQATWDAGTVIDFPVGTVIAKTFLLSADLTDPDSARTIVETRLLLRGETEWHAWPYLWRADGSDAELHVRGEVFDFTFVDPAGDTRTAHYMVPQKNQCVDCHETYNAAGDRVIRPLGPEPWLIHDGTLLESLIADDRLTGAPELSTVTAAVDWADVEARGVDALSPEEVDLAARDYLHVNCAHCHSPRGIEGVTSQFFLDRDTTDLFHLGVCKRPGSAGEGGEDREFDIVPGDPEQSILWYRLSTEDVGAMMPDIGRSLAHPPGADLIWRWIAQMEPQDCSASD